MSFPMDSYCMECYLRRNLELVRPLGSEEQTTAFAFDLLNLIATMPKNTTSPQLGPALTELLDKHYHLGQDRYRKKKEQSNRFVLERLKQIRELIFSADDPILAGLQFAILGNYLDFSALQGNVSFQTLSQMLTKATDIHIDPAAYKSFRADLENGHYFLYLTDNAGEIGFDRLFAEAIHTRYPELDITFCVRGGFTQNDATREDALQMGIPFPVIDNGNSIAGTQIDLLCPEAATALQTADVILAKGMGNTETLYGCGLNVYYAFLTKCIRFCNIFRQPMMTPMFVRDGQ